MYSKPAAGKKGGAPVAAQVMGAVLIFLPGWDEIVRLKDKLEGNPHFGSSRSGSGVGSACRWGWGDGGLVKGAGARASGDSAAAVGSSHPFFHSARLAAGTS